MKTPNTKRGVLTAAKALGVFRVAKYLTRHSPRILMYHRFGENNDRGRVAIANFDRQMRILRNDFNVVPLQCLAGCVRHGEPVPPNIAVVTIDDGYDDFYRYAFPILRKYRLPATVYVTTDFVDGKIWLWPDLIEYILGHTNVRDYTLDIGSEKKQFRLTNCIERQIAWNDIADHCLRLTEADKNWLIAELGRDLNVSVPPSPVNGYQALSWRQVREMKKHGIDIGGHTRTHPRLTALSRAELMHEVEGCKARIEEMIDSQIECFAYPNGTTADYDDGVKAAVRAAGYTSAVVAYFDRREDDVFELRRYGIGHDMLEFSKAAFGLRYLRTPAT